jgi:hypothetical protein
MENNRTDELSIRLFSGARKTATRQADYLTAMPSDSLL